MINLTHVLDIDNVTAGGIFAGADFSLAILSLVLNVIILATIKNSNSLCSDVHFVMYACIAASNVIITSFVKLLSTVLCGHAVAKNKVSVPFQFCGIYNIFSRLTWFIFPYSILIVSWLDLLEIMSQRFSKSELELDVSSLMRVEDEGVLTRRHNILKEREVIQLMKSLKSSSSVDSILTSRSKGGGKTLGQQEKETINSAAKMWKSKALDKKREDISLKKKRKVFKQKSKSIDNTLDMTKTVPSIDNSKLSHSCSELTREVSVPLSAIKEEDDETQNHYSNQGSFRRKIFAKSKTQQLTLSLSPGSSLKSFKSSNQSLSSLKKQVSFDDSLSSDTRVTMSKTSGKIETRLVPESETMSMRPSSRASNVSSNNADVNARDLKYAISVWSLAAIYCILNKQEPSELCSVTEGKLNFPFCALMLPFCIGLHESH